MASIDTREQLLASATSLFAEHGFDGTSVRDITTAARANQAAIHYHFGSKDGLLRAATDNVVGPLNRRRHQLLDELLARRSGHPSSDEVLRVFLQADVETLLTLDGNGAAARLLARVYRDPNPALQEMARQQFGETGARFMTLFAAALPELSSDELAWRVDQIVAVIVNLFARWPDDGMDAQSASQLLDRLVAFLGPGLRAPPATESPSA